MFLTPNGLKNIANEISQIKINMNKTSIAISEAREKGDLSENEEFHAAKRTYNKLTDQLMRLSDMQANSSIIKPGNVKSNKVQFGAQVTIENLETGERKTYTILDTYESDPSNNIISLHTPVGKAMLNLECGNFFSVNIYNKLTDFEIIEIVYKDL